MRHLTFAADASHLPKLVDWAAVCPTIRQPPAKRGTITPLVCGTSSDVSAVVQRLRESLVSRGVLCESESECQVEDMGGGLLMIVLPPDTVRAQLCEPFGEHWQQFGLTVGSGHNLTVDLHQFSRWWCAIQTRGGSPFLRVSDDRLSHLLGRKPPLANYFQGRFHALPTDSPGAVAAAVGNAVALRELLKSTTGHAWNTTTKLIGRCAVVGSGFGLRCGAPRGSEIDAHDAVFRSNSAQILSTAGIRAPLREVLKKTQLDPLRVGARTTFRINVGICGIRAHSRNLRCARYWPRVNPTHKRSLEQCHTLSPPSQFASPG